MSTRIAILEGWGYPGNPRARRKHHRARRASRAQRAAQAKMKACAVKWSRGPKRGKYTLYMKKCMGR